MTPDASTRTPVSLVTGFLGSGKTTLIAALLRQPGMAGTAVIVNEFGAVGIDDAIFAQSLDAGDVVLMSNGCLCCTAGDDLAMTVWSLTIRAGERPRRILIETTGLADPVPVLLRLLADPRLRRTTRLDSVVATVDAVNGLRNLADQPVAARQGAVADRRLITKADLVEPGDVAALSDRLKGLNPGAGIRVVTHGAVDAAELFGAALYDPERGRADLDRWMSLDAYRAEPLHGTLDRQVRFSGGAFGDRSVGSWLVEESRPIDWQRFSPRLGEIIARYGDALLRVKGVVQTTDDPRPLVIHGVQRLFHAPVRLERSGGGEPRTSIVVIGDSRAEPAVLCLADALAETAVSNDVPEPSQAVLRA